VIDLSEIQTNNLVLIDIDGVLTDGRVTMDIGGNETKTICFRDLDAIGVGRRAGYEFVLVTGEATPMVDVLAKRFRINHVFRGCKDKLKTIKEIAEVLNIPLKRLVYLGDSDSDAEALKAVGMGIAPKDAALSARYAAHYVSEFSGGTGVLLDAVHKLISGDLIPDDGDE